MLPSFEEDKQLFSWDHLEGEFRTWTHLWTRLFAVANFLDTILVDNYGTSYIDDSGATVSHIITRANVLTTIANRYHTPLDLGYYVGYDVRSISGKYVPHKDVVVGRTFYVYRRGALIFTRLITLDKATATYIDYMSISPDGRYIVMVIDDSVAGIFRGVMLYEGR